jgi:hypothetical protein
MLVVLVHKRANLVKSLLTVENRGWKLEDGSGKQEVGRRKSEIGSRKDVQERVEGKDKSTWQVII